MKYLIIVLVLAVIVAVLLAARRSGPRVTHIEHRRDERDEHKDDDA
ncbi:MAG: hypothetical protein ACR2KH_02445 [Sphingomicrobium sp.]